MISFNGKCKICNHNLSDHKKVKFIYIQKEESEKLINDDIEDLLNYTKFLLGKQKEEMFHMNAINEDNDFLQKALNNFNNQIKNCDKEIEKVKTSILTVENEIYGALNNIKNNLDFLRQNALNKENRTINIFVEQYAKNKNDKEKKIIEDLFQKFSSLEKEKNS